ncbi:proteasomal ATPase-associated factor 1 [Exaiptasia diaphana]|uniref:Proteasomal ATPase-associated factor 1 n=1 Tax=Exaiptasia diaphana TaxID=2652724 RepID=A0A913XZB3_EXADI|nr:proteasomal ATPase-associated factor 1 [Exaiptasia diaphana]KXJ23715.1 Proteasomal ATPase-associated factor 1 [Exaiptasia diaphana]
MADGMEVSPNIQEIPRLTIQYDWRDAFRNGEKAWVACSRLGQPSIYGDLKYQSDDSESVQTTEGFTVDAMDNRSITVSHPDSKCSSKFISPSHVISGIHKKCIRCIDISPGGALGVTLSDDEQLTVWDTNTGSKRCDLVGHIADINCCKFFPSGEVIASGGMDMTIRIWSAIDGTCPVILKGHKGGITDIDIVDRGRNIVSCSRDGTVRLWDCGESKCIAVITNVGCPINNSSLKAVDGINLGRDDSPTSDREVGTQGKLLLLAREDGVLSGIALQSREQVFEFKNPSAFNCCTFLSGFEVCGGTEDGKIWILDIRNPSSPLAMVQRSKSPLQSVLSLGNTGFVASSGDGSCFYWDTSNSLSNGKSFTWELIGPDCDPVYKTCRHGNTIYTVCRDALIRKYILDI